MCVYVSSFSITIVAITHIHWCELSCSHVGVFQFILQVTDFVSDKVYSFQQWRDNMMLLQDCNSDEDCDELSELIKSSFNDVLMASQYVIKQYNIVQSNVMKSGMCL